MAKPRDQEALECYTKVLLTLGHVAGYVQWRKLPLAWIKRELRGVTSQAVVEEMRKYVQCGGKIEQVEETRPEYVAWRFHYDLRLPVTGRHVYVETVLEQAASIEDCTIWVVNIHDV
jgi:hypothetical protein